MVFILEKDKMTEPIKDECNEHYDMLKAKIDKMSIEEKDKRLEELGKEIFIIANSFAGDETGSIAVQLHKASNAINKASLMIEGDEEKLARHHASEIMSMRE